MATHHDAEVSAEARAANERATASIGERRFVDAIPDGELAVSLAPTWTAPWRNLAIAYKHDLRWRECLEACERALLDVAESDEGVHWNAGIAATALEDWARARTAWRACGIEVPDGDGPIEMKLGLAPVRLAPKGHAEVVWCTRLDPCRARIENVPLPESGRRHGDLMLHDGEPRGQRKLGTSMVAVFDELTLLAPSGMGTWLIELDVPDETSLEQLLAPLEGTKHEDWTDNVRMLCAACSLGAADGHDHEPAGDGWQRRRHIGIAAPSEESFAPLRGFLGRWRRGVVSVTQKL